jgi:hypothetical protein
VPAAHITLTLGSALGGRPSDHTAVTVQALSITHRNLLTRPPGPTTRKKRQPSNSEIEKNIMHGSPLTPYEAAASIASQVFWLQANGFDRDRAIQRVAAQTGIAPEKVRWCANGAPANAPRSAQRNTPSRAHDERQHQPANDCKANPIDAAATARTRRRWKRPALAATLVAAAFALASPALAAARTLNVNPVSGSDANSAAATKPLETLGKALSK